MGRDDAGQGGGEFGPHRHLALAFVGEIEKLLDNFRPAFFRIQLRWLQHGSVPFDEAVSARDFPPAIEDVIANGAIVWRKSRKPGSGCMRYFG